MNVITADDLSVFIVGGKPEHGANYKFPTTFFDVLQNEILLQTAIRSQKYIIYLIQRHVSDAPAFSMPSRDPISVRKNEIMSFCYFRNAHPRRSFCLFSFYFIIDLFSATPSIDLVLL